jgi:hypothetical protein
MSRPERSDIRFFKHDDGTTTIAFGFSSTVPEIVKTIADFCGYEAKQGQGMAYTLEKKGKTK